MNSSKKMETKNLEIAIEKLERVSNREEVAEIAELVINCFSMYGSSATYVELKSHAIEIWRKFFCSNGTLTKSEKLSAYIFKEAIKTYLEN